MRGPRFYLTECVGIRTVNASRAPRAKRIPRKCAVSSVIGTLRSLRAALGDCYESGEMVAEMNGEIYNHVKLADGLAINPLTLSY
jgi:hypothetical protein